MRKQLYFNGEYLPNQEEPQISIDAYFPDVGLFYFKGATYMGIRSSDQYFEISFTILGFGIVYNRNWDI